MQPAYPKHVKAILEKANVAILIPVFDKIDYRFLMSLSNLIGHSVKNGVNYAGISIAHRSKTVSARNQLIKSAVGDKDITHFLMIDDDHTFNANLLCNLLSRDKDFICAVATQKSPPFYPVIYKKSASSEHLYHSYLKWPKAVFEVDACGFGCVLIKRQIFEEMEYPWIEEKTGTYGHDLHFCSKMRAKGIPMYCDGSQAIKHLGHETPEVGVEDFFKYQPRLLEETANYVRENGGENEVVSLYEV